MRILDLSGQWQCDIPGISAPVMLPGTLDESGIGFPDQNKNPWHPDAEENEALKNSGVIATRLTRRFSWEGPARFSRRIRSTFPPGSRLFLECERARCLSLEVNGIPVPDFVPPTISTPHIFEVTSRLTGEDNFVLISDNSYPGLPHDDILFSSAATDETQTNWNGILGYFRLREEQSCFIAGIRVLPRGNTIDVHLTLSSDRVWQGSIRISCEALMQPAEMTDCRMEAGETEFIFRGLALREDARRWDEEEGALYRLQAEGTGLEASCVRFGIRDFGDDGQGHLSLNGRRIFLRGEANCCVFPETGHPPMSVEEWCRVLSVYRSYGVNCMRFHSHIPPEEAFAAADEMGMMMQPELSQWNPRNALETEESYQYYSQELQAVIRMLANHPSFVMMTFGNELCTGETGHQRMEEMLSLARALDDTRMYATASNEHYGMRGCDAGSDFYASQSYYDHLLRATCAEMKGYLNQDAPSADHDYSAAVTELRKTYGKPVFTFEVGQYEVLPDFREIAEFRGITRPDNLELIRRRVAERGLEDRWEKYCEATGELALRCYREEAEAALRTEALSGISFLGLQDFPGQGTALVGMLNSHLCPKPYRFARPERFHAFLTSVLPLALLPSWTWTRGDKASIPIRIANYGKKPFSASLRWELAGSDGVLSEGSMPEQEVPIGLSSQGNASWVFPDGDSAEKLELRLWCGESFNSYTLWVYPNQTPVCPPDVLEVRTLDERAKDALLRGGKVYLSPDAVPECLPRSIRTQFSTDFWSVGTFPKQEGGMGQLIEAGHPLFRRFPTDFHTDWQWHRMASQRALILPEPCQAIITEMDSYAFLRPMAQLLEARCLNGRLMISSLNLHRLQAFPECRALQDAIYMYMSSEAFQPEQAISPETVSGLVRPGNNA